MSPDTCRTLEYIIVTSICLCLLIPGGLAAFSLWWGFTKERLELRHQQKLELIRAKKEARAHEIRMLTRNLLSLPPGEFEEYVGGLFKLEGYKVLHVGGRGDYGIDLVMFKDGVKVVVQCKRYSPEHKVGAEEIRAFVGAMVRAEARHGIFVTASDFTAGAYMEAEASLGMGFKIILVNGDRLLALVKKHGLPAQIMVLE